MTKSFTLKDLSCYDHEIEQLTHPDSDVKKTTPDTLTINYILAYAQALYVINTEYTGTVSMLLN